MAKVAFKPGGVDAVQTYPRATIYLHLFDCKVEYSVDTETVRRSASTLPEASKTITISNASSITIFGLEKIATTQVSDVGGFASIDNYNSARITSDDTTYWTKQLGSVPNLRSNKKAVKIGVFMDNPYPYLNVAVYPSDDMVFWTRLEDCTSCSVESFKNSWDEFPSLEIPITTVSKFSYQPAFMKADDAYEHTIYDTKVSFTYVSNFIIPSNMSYAQVIHSDSILHPYPSVTNQGITKRMKYNIPVKTLTLAGKEKCVPPIWVLVRGVKDKDAPYYSPENYTSEASQTNKGTYIPRFTPPEDNNPYYIMKGRSYQGVVGYNPSCQGNPRWQPKYGIPSVSVLPNCVGYVVGRFAEIIGENACNYLCWSYGAPDAATFIKYFGTDGEPKAPKAKISMTPQLGACIVWGPWTNNPCGHVGIVEEISDDGETIKVSHSGWGENSDPGGRLRSVATCKRSNNYAIWGHPFIGFLLNPAVRFSGLYDQESGSIPWDAPVPNKIDYSDWKVTTNTNKSSISDIKVNIERELIGTVNDIQGLNLLTTPTLVESPFIEVKIGKYTFGSYTKQNTVERTYSEQRVTYPNYMQSLKITKTNGAINQYVLTMQYQIQAGEDPNLIDKVFSSVSDTRKITLSYGDWNAPSFIYRNEDAIITKVISDVDFAQSRITYTVYCTSTALSLKSKVYDFPSRNAKPSDIIKGYIKNNTYGITDLFYGMRTDVDKALSLIASDDKVVNIKPQQHVDILTYLNFLVANMISSSNKDTSIQDSSYALLMRDEISGELEGPYFKVVKVATTSKALTSTNIYEVDVGFPGETLVMNFKINNDNSWAILYNYSDKITQDEYVYKIDNQGHMYSEYSPNITTSDRYKETTNVNKTWWTQMTQFPITATLTIKGLIRPAMLMENVRINAYFYGQRHVASGLYVITKQEDTVDRSGYKTTLSLLRIAGDEDNLYNIKQIEIDSNAEGSFGGGKVGSGSFGGGKVGSGMRGNSSEITGKSSDVTGERQGAFADSSNPRIHKGTAD